MTKYLIGLDYQGTKVNNKIELNEIKVCYHPHNLPSDTHLYQAPRRMQMTPVRSLTVEPGCLLPENFTGRLNISTISIISTISTISTYRRVGEHCQHWRWREDQLHPHHREVEPWCGEVEEGETWLEFEKMKHFSVCWTVWRTKRVHLAAVCDKTKQAAVTCCSLCIEGFCILSDKVVLWEALSDKVQNLIKQA